jgi:hypothetical protein
MIEYQTMIHRRTWLAAMLLATTVGMMYMSEGDGQNAAAFPPELGVTGMHECVTFDAGGDRVENGTLVMLGQALVGEAQGNGVTAMLGGIHCLQAAQTTTCPALSGDFDGDDGVNLADFGILQVCFGDPPVGQCLCTDLNGDDAIDLIDFSIWLSIASPEE